MHIYGVVGGRKYVAAHVLVKGKKETITTINQVVHKSKWCGTTQIGPRGNTV